MSEEETTKATITTPLGTVSMNGKKTAEFISIMSLCGLLVVGYALWNHKAQAEEGFKATQAILKENQVSQRESFRELTNALKEQTRQQKYQTCILSIPVSEREREYQNPNGLCARLTK